MALIVLLFALPVIIGATIFAMGNGKSSDGGNLPNLSSKGEKPQGLTNSQDVKPIKDREFTLTPVPKFNYTRRVDGSYTQVAIKRDGESTPTGVIIVNDTQAQGLGELVAIQTGGYNPEAVTNPVIKPITIGGRKGSLIVTDLLNDTVRVTAVTIIKGRSVLIVFSGPLGNEKDLEAMVRDHASSIKFT
jgi:hypothetical protein